MAEQVGYLLGSQLTDAAIRLFLSVVLYSV